MTDEALETAVRHSVEVLVAGAVGAAVMEMHAAQQRLSGAALAGHLMRGCLASDGIDATLAYAAWLRVAGRAAVRERPGA